MYASMDKVFRSSSMSSKFKQAWLYLRWCAWLWKCLECIEIMRHSNITVLRRMITYGVVMLIPRNFIWEVKYFFFSWRESLNACNVNMNILINHKNGLKGNSCWFYIGEICCILFSDFTIQTRSVYLNQI